MNKIVIFVSILFVSFSLVRSACEIESRSRFACFAQSTGTTTCCFKPSEDNQNQNDCIEKSKATSDYDCGALDKDGETYKEYEFTQYKPQQKELELSLEPCGETNPGNKDDCTDYSTIMNSCCKFTNEESNESGCFYIGKKFSGSSGKHTFEEENEEGKPIKYTYQCSSSLLSFAKISIALFLVLF